MKFVIAHLYYDLMNLYGESGNVIALQKALEQLGIDVSIKFITIDDEIDFSKYDLVYIGAGTEKNQLLALEHLLSYKEELWKRMSHLSFFATGNAIELFGREIIDEHQVSHPALSFFPFRAERKNMRIVDEIVATCDFLKTPVIGFQNQKSVIEYLKNPVFQVRQGVGSSPNTKYDGIMTKQFFGTYFIGPILIRNPHLLTYYVKQLVKKKDPEFKMKRLNLTFEKKAYEEHLKQLELTEK